MRGIYWCWCVRAVILFMLCRVRLKKEISQWLDRMHIAEHLAVRDLIALAQFLLLPQDDYTLACLLKSPLYNVREPALLDLCYGRGDVSLWERLMAHAAEDWRCARAVEELTALLARTDYISPYRLYAELLYARGGQKRFARRMGSEMEEVLEVFMGLALDYERSHTPSLQGFLSWLERGNSEIKRDMEQEVQAVRIMTVHGAKGLEAPIVFLPDTTQLPSLSDRLFILSNDDISYVLGSPRSESDNEMISALRAQRKEAERHEYNRLLYVAMTRARDELYICGWAGKHKPSEDCWYEQVCAGLSSLDEVVQTDYGKLVFQDAGVTASVTSDDGEDETNDIELPAVLLQPPPEEKAHQHFLSPSHLDDTDMTPKLPIADAVPGDALARARKGRLVHRLLEVLSPLGAVERQPVGKGYMHRHAGYLEEKERDDVLDSVLALMKHPDVADMFSPDALVEVPIAGEVEGRRLSGLIDRLLVRDREVLVIDYKTGHVPDSSSIPVSYIRQMQAYAALLERLYPGRTVRCMLLFTEGPVCLTVV